MRRFNNPANAPVYRVSTADGIETPLFVVSFSRREGGTGTDPRIFAPAQHQGLRAGVGPS